jgi:hypothetical protein
MQTTKERLFGLQGFARHRRKCFQKPNNTRQTTRHKLYKQSKSKGYRVLGPEYRARSEK